MKHKSKQQRQTTIQKMINSLERRPFLSEKELIGITFNTNTNFAYAAELRRAVGKGEIARVRAKAGKAKVSYFYFVPKPVL